MTHMLMPLAEGKTGLSSRGRLCMSDTDSVRVATISNPLQNQHWRV